VTRKTLNRKLLTFAIALGAVLVIAFASKVSDSDLLKKIYSYINEMSLLLVTILAPYIAYLFQKRSNFLQSLREEWREIVQAKSVLVAYCDRDDPTVDDYIDAYYEISQCIDYMRIVYSNVGETDRLIGFYPYAPLHHMRAVMETLDPRKEGITAEMRKAAKEQIWDAFNAVREHFLDEFDVEPPSRPIVVYEMKRRKRPGGTRQAQKLHEAQARSLQ
jgi:hypothetical protein